MRVKHFNLGVGSQIFKALSDESRIRILYLIAKNKEMCISDLELVLDFTQTKISRHLIYLKNAGLVTHRKVDQWTYYAIKDELVDFVELVIRYFEKNPELANDLSTYKTLYSNRELAINKIEKKNRRYEAKF
ncbi:ArsR/SmtB family transcription factor [Thermoflexibacter ruber]|uniref:Regulatory protein, arsR family n=1 Tax=Thermoflexibacter ruber TaxID=1003 RepID=A0A1I2JX93_9BACT|nr:metalloregulator ArsR/SmtB family transcription factor [Thermoflexibacter ruber]SFF58773.1 regulatory protein, arsR family [Thermoflexibacter ruber]